MDLLFGEERERAALPHNCHACMQSTIMGPTVEDRDSRNTKVIIKEKSAIQKYVAHRIVDGSFLLEDSLPIPGVIVPFLILSSLSHGYSGVVWRAVLQLGPATPVGLVGFSRRGRLM